MVKRYGIDWAEKCQVVPARQVGGEVAGASIEKGWVFSLPASTRVWSAHNADSWRTLL